MRAWCYVFWMSYSHTPRNASASSLMFGVWLYSVGGTRRRRDRTKWVGRQYTLSWVNFCMTPFNQHRCNRHSLTSDNYLRWMRLGCMFFLQSGLCWVVRYASNDFFPPAMIATYENIETMENNVMEYFRNAFMNKANGGILLKNQIVPYYNSYFEQTESAFPKLYTSGKQNWNTEWIRAVILIIMMSVSTAMCIVLFSLWTTTKNF